MGWDDNNILQVGKGWFMRGRLRFSWAPSLQVCLPVFWKAPSPSPLLRLSHWLPAWLFSCFCTHVARGRPAVKFSPDPGTAQLNSCTCSTARAGPGT